MILNVYRADLLQLRAANQATLVAPVASSTGGSVPIDDATKALLTGAVSVKLVAVGPLKISPILKENSEKVRIPTGLNTAKFACTLQANGVNFGINLHSVTLYTLLQGNAQCVVAFYANTVTKAEGFWVGMSCAGQPSALSGPQIDELESLLSVWSQKKEVEDAPIEVDALELPE